MVLEPAAITVPSPLMLTSFALLVSQVKVVDCPCSITAGFAANVAVGAGGGGGGGGGVACAAFLWQAEDTNTAVRIAANTKHFDVSCFTRILLNENRVKSEIGKKLGLNRSSASETPHLPGLGFRRCNSESEDHKPMEEGNQQRRIATLPAFAILTRNSLQGLATDITDTSATSA